MSSPEEKHLDVLQNIEFAIVQEYRAAPALIDLDVMDALDALVRLYSAEASGRQASARPLGDRAARIAMAVRAICEWRLGRGHLAGSSADPSSPIPISDLIECLQRVRKSVRRWNRVGGRQGYLDFVRQYIV